MNYTITQLKRLAQEKNIKGYSKMNKDELYSILNIESENLSLDNLSHLDKDLNEKIPERVLKSKSPQRALKSKSPEIVLESKSPQRVLKSKSPQRILKSKSPERALKSKSPERVLKSKSPQRALKSKSPETVSKNKSPQRVLKSKSPQRILKSKSPEHILKTKKKSSKPKTLKRGELIEIAINKYNQMSTEELNRKFGKYKKIEIVNFENEIFNNVQDENLFKYCVTKINDAIMKYKNFAHLNNSESREMRDMPVKNIDEIYMRLVSYFFNNSNIDLQFENHIYGTTVNIFDLTEEDDLYYFHNKNQKQKNDFSKFVQNFFEFCSDEIKKSQDNIITLDIKKYLLGKRDFRHTQLALEWNIMYYMVSEMIDGWSIKKEDNGNLYLKK